MLPSSYMTILANIFHSKNQTEVAKVLLKATRNNKSDQKFAFVNYIQPLRVKIRQTDRNIKYADVSSQ